MREFDAIREYPQPKATRYVGKNIRTIENKIIASYRGEGYYDGDRNNGYGGFNYDGRWKKIADSMTSDYNLTENSAVLQIGCEKGFLLHDFHEKFPKMKLRGAEVAEYPIEKSMPSIKEHISKTEFNKLPFQDNEFDFVVAVGVIYCLNLRDAIACIKEIQRVGKGKSFITLGAFYDDVSERLFKAWSVLGSTILHVDDWVKVLKEAGYTGDYAFTTSKKLKLVEKTD